MDVLGAFLDGLNIKVRLFLGGGLWSAGELVLVGNTGTADNSIFGIGYSASSQSINLKLDIPSLFEA